MKEYDVVVLGSGSGMFVVYEAILRGLSTALIDRGPLGGTCPNFGCIPSKMLMYPADRIVEINEASRLGITVRVEHIDFSGIMDRMRRSVEDAQRRLRQSFSALRGLDLLRGRRNLYHSVRDESRRHPRCRAQVLYRHRLSPIRTRNPGPRNC